MRKLMLSLVVLVSVSAMAEHADVPGAGGAGRPSYLPASDPRVIAALESTCKAYRDLKALGSQFGAGGASGGFTAPPSSSLAIPGGASSIY